MAQVHLPVVGQGLFQTNRKDSWWVGPLVTALVLGGFSVYATWAAAQNADYRHGPYLSPFYSPLFQPSWLPAWLSPAFLILGGPLGFRATCYYYRKAYYRAFFLDPPACAVGERHKDYKGETAFPFIIQNLHRFFFYVACVFAAVLTYDAIISYNFDGAFGIGVGSLVLTVNAVLISAYTLSCHSCRHAVGGNVNCFSKVPGGEARYWLWRGVSRLNRNHMLFAWLSLFSVALADVYVRLCARGVITDLRIL
jgi:hypothetical protein